LLPAVLLPSGTCFRELKRGNTDRSHAVRGRQKSD
jgi:hypothetical protein